MKRLLLLVAITTLSLLPATASEVIDNFHSRLEVQADGNLIVTETIIVTAEGNEIKRGIYRDFPTLYAGKWGLRSRVGFEVKEVLRDGKPDAWHFAKLSNGLRIYIGNENTFLQPAKYTYTITYHTTRQIGFFQNHDELYWNVTGNGWNFSILEASACVMLPPGTPVLGTEAYTGAKGDQGKAYRIVPKPGCSAYFETTRELLHQEGITIVVTWPKGFVTAVGGGQNWLNIIWDNLGVASGLLGLILVCVYFFAAWTIYGRDPSRGVIIPRYQQPEGFTPQDVRYLSTLGSCDNKSFTAAILHLAVQGGLTIKESTDKIYTLQRNDARAGLSKEEQDLRQALFKGSTSLRLTSKHHAIVTGARTALQQGVTKKIGGYVKKNTGIWIVGLLITLVPLGISLFGAKSSEGALFMMLWLSIWSMGCAALSVAVVTSWRAKNKLGAIPITLFSIPFFGGWIVGAGALVHMTSPWVAGIYVIGITITTIFHRLLKAPTVEGRRIMDEIDGFQEYLSVGEKDRLELENPPDRTPELFEKFLPYALVLGVEQRWTKQFEEVLSAANYEPTWYSGNNSGMFSAAAFSSGLSSSFSGAISSASTAPGSSSGSSGGGSSGGGGGGGGGGGW